jgi:SHO1 osmosensor
MACVIIRQILWVLYFSSEEDSLVLHFFNYFGTGGLTGPSRRGGRRHTRSSSHGMQGNGGYGYTGGGILGGGISSGGYDAKDAMASTGSVARSSNPIHHDLGTPTGGGLGNRSNPTITGAPPGSAPHDSAPLMGQPQASSTSSGPSGGQDMVTTLGEGVGESYLYRAKALYACPSSHQFLVI